MSTQGVSTARFADLSLQVVNVIHDAEPWSKKHLGDLYGSGCYYYKRSMSSFKRRAKSS